jgi:hypothetical protein
MRPATGARGRSSARVCDSFRGLTRVRDHQRSCLLLQRLLQLSACIGDEDVQRAALQRAALDKAMSCHYEGRRRPQTEESDRSMILVVQQGVRPSLRRARRSGDAADSSSSLCVDSCPLTTHVRHDVNDLPEYGQIASQWSCHRPTYRTSDGSTSCPSPQLSC